MYMCQCSRKIEKGYTPPAKMAALAQSLCHASKMPQPDLYNRILLEHGTFTYFIVKLRMPR